MDFFLLFLFQFRIFYGNTTVFQNITENTDKAKKSLWFYDTLHKYHRGAAYNSTVRNRRNESTIV